VLTAEQIIALLKLEPLPREGGFFRRTYLAAESVAPGALPERYPDPKPFSSAILYLLTPTEFSALHRLRTDEVYHFYLGDPVEQLLLYPDGQSQVVLLGQNLEDGQRVQSLVPRGVWQGTRLQPYRVMPGRIRAGLGFALLGTTMSPAFDLLDFEPGERQPLLRHYPDQAARVEALTRED
jgi:predicted cupin superfamily sugar epimerase